MYSMKSNSLLDDACLMLLEPYPQLGDTTNFKDKISAGS